MPKKLYIALEQHVINTFQNNRLFVYHNKLYELIRVGKPRPQGGGECKTDVYVELKNKKDGKVDIFKISVKTDGSHEFEENKVSAERAEAYFGENWEEIIINATSQLKDNFESKTLLYATGSHPTKPNSITLGWKMEIANKARSLSVPVPLTNREIIDYVYKGTNLPINKKNALVNDIVIENSGVAEYLLVTTIQHIQSPVDVLNQIVSIDGIELNETYLIFTANNYRTDVKKADGPRPLAVRIEWRVENGKLTPCFCYDKPLKYTGERDMVPLVIYALEILGKKNIVDINPDKDISDPKIYKR